MYVAIRGLEAVSDHTQRCRVLFGSRNLELQVDSKTHLSSIKYTWVPNVRTVQKTSDEMQKSRTRGVLPFQPGIMPFKQSPASPASINITTMDPARGTLSSQISGTQNAFRSLNTHSY